MKTKSIAIIAAALALAGCNSTSSLTAPQAIAIAEPLVSAGLTLVLQNNPSYIPIAKTVGADLSTSNFSDLTVVGINAVVSASVAKAGGTPAEAALFSAALDAGVAVYLEKTVQSSLASDPNAVGALQALGGAIASAATTAAASPKP